MVKTQLLSKNLLLSTNELIKNSNLMKYIYYHDIDPLTKDDIIDANEKVFLTNLFPTPFVPPTKNDSNNNPVCQVHVYYGRGDLESVAHEEIILQFDIIVSKSLWLCRKSNEDGTDYESIIRPYEMMYEIIDSLADKSIGTLGKIKFTSFVHMYVNEYIDGIRLFSVVDGFAKKG